MHFVELNLGGTRSQEVMPDIGYLHYLAADLSHEQAKEVASADFVIAAGFDGPGALAHLFEHIPASGRPCFFLMKGRDHFSVLELGVPIEVDGKPHDSIVRVLSDDKPATLRRAFLRFLSALEAQGKSGGYAPSDAYVGSLLEAAALGWREVSPHLELSPDDRRIGDALAALMAELATVSDPPRGLLRRAVAWLSPRVDLFADEFAKTAGKSAGVGAAAGTAWLITRLPQLRDVLAQVADLLGSQESG